jgi:indolepyruvate ferredoxin oxidoreductase beta subunit
MRLQIVLVGVGGGGIVFATKMLAQTALRQGIEVIGSETHGMSQRGGSVISHLKLGGFQSPLVRRGAADILIAFNTGEAFKAMDYLAGGGKSIVNAAEDQFPGETLKAHMEQQGIEYAILAADAIALEIGASGAVNMVMLGFAAGIGALPFDPNQLIETAGFTGSVNQRATNQAALRRGAQAAMPKEISR